MIPPHNLSDGQLLDFYLEAGVDALLGEEPVDRFAVETGAIEPTSTPRPVPSPTLPRKREGSESPSIAAPPPPDAAAMEARQAAKSAKSLEDLRAILETFGGCALKATATQLVFADAVVDHGPNRVIDQDQLIDAGAAAVATAGIASALARSPMPR